MMKKVAMIYSVPATQTDGASRVVLSFVKNDKRFKDNNIKIDLYAPQCDAKESCSGQSRKSIREHIKRLVFSLDYAGVIRIAFDYLIRGKKAVDNYFEKRNDNYELVLFHEPATCYNYIKRDATKKVVLILHTVGDFYSTSLIEFPILRYTLFYKIYLSYVKKKLLKNIDLIVFNSQLAVDNFYKLNPKVDKNLATFVDNGISDFDEPEVHLQHPTSCFNIVCVGNIVERKGQSLIVGALSEMTEEEKAGIRVSFVGDGNMRSELEERVRAYRLEDIVTFHGTQNNVIPFLDCANIFMLPSKVEGMPISIIEAMRSALPVVSTPVGGIPYQIVNGENGLLINPTKDDVKQVLININNYNWELMGHNSRKRYLEKFSINQTIDKYSKLFNNICN